MDSDTARWITVDKSGIVVHGPCKVWGFIVAPSVAQGYATVYDGLDAGSGRLFSILKTITVGVDGWLFSKPVQFDRGIYVDFTSNVTSVTVLWEPAD